MYNSIIVQHKFKWTASISKEKKQHALSLFNLIVSSIQHLGIRRDHDLHSRPNRNPFNNIRPYLKYSKFRYLRQKMGIHIKYPLSRLRNIRIVSQNEHYAGLFVRRARPKLGVHFRWAVETPRRHSLRPKGFARVCTSVQVGTRCTTTSTCEPNACASTPSARLSFTSWISRITVCYDVTRCYDEALKRYTGWLA